MYPDPNMLKEISDSLPSSTKELLFNPAADAIGRGIGGILYWVFQKPIKLGIIKQHEFDDLANKAAKGFEAIPVINRDDSKMGLAIKTLENSRYSLDSEILRQMFANLLAGTVDNRVNKNISPLFPTILGNMSTEDAIFLQHFSKTITFPIVTIDRVDGEKISTQVEGIIDWSYPDKFIEKEIGVNLHKSIDFFTSFGILIEEVDGLRTLASEAAQEWYKNFEHTQMYKEADAYFKTQGKHAAISQGYIQLTKLGQSFVKSIVL